MKVGVVEQQYTASLHHALRQFELAEANLVRLEALWHKIEGELPTGPAFGAPPEFEEWCIAFKRLLSELPAVDGFRVEDRLHDYDEVGQMWLDALELGEPEVQVGVSQELAEQGRQLREYRHHFQAKRRELVRDRLVMRMRDLDQLFAGFDPGAVSGSGGLRDSIAAWRQLREVVDEIEALLGGSSRPEQWEMLQRSQRDANASHIAYELMESALYVWPSIRASLTDGLYGEFDPVPVASSDLGEIVNEGPTGPVSMRLNWSMLGDEDFERLVYQLISGAKGYENVQWLQKTHAPDRGRDLSADRIYADSLGSVRRFRTIIQCKHWLSRSVGRSDVGEARDAMELWWPPRVDILVIATSGRFSVDAVTMIEKHNQSDTALSIEMWPESRLETLLAARPHLIGQFGLRRESQQIGGK